MAAEIIATGRAVPARRVTNEDLAARVDTTDEWIRSHTGIGARHLADQDTACSDLALEAAKQALAMAAEKDGGGQTPEEFARTLDVILISTATADYYGCPSTACIVQDKLGARNAAALDITAGCTGFIYGLEAASGLLAVNTARTRALVIGS
jgi:3-oxoacyl-[acyl-carrier-protein] synthase-3